MEGPQLVAAAPPELTAEEERRQRLKAGEPSLIAAASLVGRPVSTAVRPACYGPLGARTGAIGQPAAAPSSLPPLCRHHPTRHLIPLILCLSRAGSSFLCSW